MIKMKNDSLVYLILKKIIFPILPLKLVILIIKHIDTGGSVALKNPKTNDEYTELMAWSVAYGFLLVSFEDENKRLKRKRLKNEIDDLEHEIEKLNENKQFG